MLALLVLAGCGNAYESLSIGPWREAGVALPPVSEPKANLIVTQIAPGTGRIVAPGDLVRIRVAPKNGRLTSFEVNYLNLPATYDVWLWTGREPPTANYSEFMSWGSLGSARLRASLIGKALHERLEITLHPETQTVVDIPLNGFTVQHFSVLQQSENPWPEVHLERGKQVEIEILDACPGRLYRRSATLRQVGYIPGMFGSNFDTFRTDTLHWSALEGDCGGATNSVRLEIGPLHYDIGGQTPSLYNWRRSYRTLSAAPLQIHFLYLPLTVWLVLTLVVAAWLYYRSQAKMRVDRSE